MTVEALLRRSQPLLTTTADASLAAAAQAMHRHGCGSLPVVRDDLLVGIISERDIVHAMGDNGAAALTMRVGRFMSAPVLTATPGDTLAEIERIMVRKRIRHLPVLDRDGDLIGNVSIRDVLAERLAASQRRTEGLRDVALALR